MRETRPSGSEGGARFYPLLLPLSRAAARGAISTSEFGFIIPLPQIPLPNSHYRARTKLPDCHSFSTFVATNCIPTCA